MTLTHYILIFFLLCCWAPSAEAAEVVEPAGTTVSPFADENIHINADRMSQNQTDGMVTAEGNVVVLSQGMNLRADQVRYSATTHMMYATGSVVLSKGPTLLKGKTLVMNMDTGMAEMDATLLTAPDSGMTISSEKLVRINENEFTALSSELTTCDMPDPSWKLGADKLKVNLLGYATGHNVIFYVKNTPVLYLPWIAFPVVLEKQTGLLLPRVGRSTSKGVQLDIPVYLVISPSQDLLLDLDLMSRRGVGTGADYRYIRTRGSEGHVSGYQVYDQTENRWRWQLAQEHKEIFSNSANLRMTVNGTSDRAFSSEFGEKSGDYNRQSNDSTINTLNTWQNYAVTSYMRYNVDLYAADNRATLQTLPSLGVSAVRDSLFSLPLYFDLDGSVDNLYREAAPSGQRLQLFPRITLLPFRSGLVQTSLFAGAHVRGYVTNTHDSAGNVQARDGDLLPEAGIRMSTSLTRIYNTEFSSLKKIRHEIVPELSYGFIQERDQRRLPLYDYTDRMIHQNMLSLSATSMLNGKFVSGDATEYRELSRLKLEARYSISGEQRDLLTLVASQHPWSDLILESETWVTKLLRLTFDARYDLYDNRLSTAVVGSEYDDRKGNLIGVGYQLARNEVEYLEGHLSTSMIKPLNLSYMVRYSFDGNTLLESVYAAEYRHKCWSVNLAVHQRPGNQAYTINFTLAGLGSK